MGQPTPSDYVHGRADDENRRLQDQAQTLAELLHADTQYAAGTRVLEVGCGVGAQTLHLARRNPGARFTSIDVAPESVTLARQYAAAAGLVNIEFLQADLLDAPFAPASFDHVFVCFVLEHLVNPTGGLSALRSLLRPGGTITIIEGDHGSVLFHPDDRAAHDAIDCLVKLQRASGGDAFIGRRLYALLVDAGFDQVHVSPRTVYADASRPEWTDGFTRRTFTAMVQGIREPAIHAGLSTRTHFDAGVRALLRTTEADGMFGYTFFKAVARRSAAHP